MTFTHNSTTHQNDTAVKVKYIKTRLKCLICHSEIVILTKTIISEIPNITTNSTKIFSPSTEINRFLNELNSQNANEAKKIKWDRRQNAERTKNSTEIENTLKLCSPLLQLTETRVNDINLNTPLHHIYQYLKIPTAHMPFTISKWPKRQDSDWEVNTWMSTHKECCLC